MERLAAPGKYVVAVSGGVDSVVLLDYLAKQMVDDQSPKIDIVVAHFDHGIRPDSIKDRLFVQELVEQYGLPFVFDRVELGAGASEANARKARYAFLEKVRQAAGADAIVTAHHQDDVLETLIINWLRGTKSRGLSSLRSTPEIRRPLLGMTKKQIRDYAHLHQLEWHEDSTNVDEAYLRNYVRMRIMPTLDTTSRQQLLAHSEKAAGLNDAIEELVAEYLQKHTTAESLNRAQYKLLPSAVSYEVLAEWLRRHAPAEITTKTLARLDAAIRNGRNGSSVDIAKGQSFVLKRADAELWPR